MGLFSVRENVRRTVNVINVPKHDIWKLRTFEEAKDFLVRTFPQIDFSTFEHLKPKNTSELVAHFDENLQGATNELQHVSDQALLEPFFLKNKGQVLFSSPKKENVGTSINHLVHHRGQLTVYMRLNNIPVPSIYGPSADERNF